MRMALLPAREKKHYRREGTPFSKVGLERLGRKAPLLSHPIPWSPLEHLPNIDLLTAIKRPNAVFDCKYPVFSIQDSECGFSCFLLMLLQPKRLLLSC